MMFLKNNNDLLIDFERYTSGVADFREGDWWIALLGDFRPINVVLLFIMLYISRFYADYVSKKKKHKKKIINTLFCTHTLKSSSTFRGLLDPPLHRFIYIC